MALPCKDYGFGHFLMCFDSVKGFTKECEGGAVLNSEAEALNRKYLQGQGGGTGGTGPVCITQSMMQFYASSWVPCC